MHPDIVAYHERLDPKHLPICTFLAEQISRALPDATSKVWHAHPVWFLGANPIVGYSVQKGGVRLMFWSGASFEEPWLEVLGEKFKDASVFVPDVGAVDLPTLQRCLEKGRTIQWDYANIVKRKGVLERLV